MDTKQLMETNYLNCKKNPFASPTEEATGDDFIGRKSILDDMCEYVVDANRIYNYHVVGLPKIGKSSLLKAFREKVYKDHINDNLIIIYISLDTCSDTKKMWFQIGNGLRKELKKRFGQTEKYQEFEENLEFEGVDEKNVDYEYVCSFSRCMKSAGFWGLVFVDEFDNFSTIASKDTVGQIRTLFSGSEFGTRAVVASRRMVERIEKEVEGAINSNVSILAATFVNGCKLKAFKEDDMRDYWATTEGKIGRKISNRYKEEVSYYVGTHPWLLNLLNKSYWAEQETKEYISDNASNLTLSEELVNKLHDSFNWAVWRDMEKWQLLRSLILSTWGPDDEIPKSDLSELERYGIIDKSQYLSETNGPIRIVISRYFTEWMKLKRYVLPFGDEWSKAEGNMRKIVKCFCDDMYQGYESNMINHLEKKYTNTIEQSVDSRFTAKGRFDAMKNRMNKNINKYPDMSTSIIDYSDPSDLPEIFFKREWSWFQQVFSKTWDEWRDKFATMNEIRNIKLHGNQGVPQVRIELAKKYCHEVNERIEAFLSKRG